MHDFADRAEMDGVDDDAAEEFRAIRVTNVTKYAAESE